MFSRVYGEGKNRQSQNRFILRERTLRERSEFYRSHTSTSLYCLSSNRYGEKRSKQKAHEKDSKIWEKELTEESKNKLKDAREIEKLKEEKSRLEEKEVLELKKTILMVEKVNLHVEENTIENNTDLFDCTEGFLGELVVRRGQEFRMTFTFQRPWSGKQDNLYLEFKLGENPRPNKGTAVDIKLKEDETKTKYMTGPKRSWGARILSQHENSLTVSVYIPPNANIGQWEYSVNTEFVQGGKKKQCLYDGKDDIIVLLNPWCKDDQVYMEDEMGRDEYVNNEHGCVFNGSSKSIGEKAWFFGQFQENILDISLHLLRKSFDYDINKKMSDAREIARALSRIVNSSDDNGVLTGNWSGKYDGGTKPTAWRGSVAILRQYDEDKEPVKFGQCWVFSAVLTTVARALGFPCRSITNFSSSHDTDMSMTIDKFFDNDGNPIPSRSRDSVWNFHVWNEVWMSRPDLDAEGKYDGWHAIDSTPQEASDNLYQCGPSPLAAIRCGDVNVGYDTKFIFAEVNAEVCNWRENGSKLILVDKNSSSVGKKISTKVANGKPMDTSFFGRQNNREDITHLYKHPEGSVAERESVMKALSGSSQCDAIFSDVTGVKIEFLEIPEPKLGEKIIYTAKVTNTSSEPRSVRLHLTVRPMTYWGGIIGTKVVKTHVYSELVIESNQCQTFDLDINHDDYIEVCDDHLSMSILALAVVRGFEDHENQVYGSDDFQVKMEPIAIQGPEDRVASGQPVELTVKFSNPTNKTLTKCQLEVEGGISVEDDGFAKKHSVYKKNVKNVGPGETVEFKVTVKPNVKPKKRFEREVEIGFSSTELPDFEGSFPINLKK